MVQFLHYHHHRPHTHTHNTHSRSISPSCNFSCGASYCLYVGSTIKWYWTGLKCLPSTPPPPLRTHSDVFQHGFSHYTTLSNSHLYDSVLCATVADVNWDGRSELVLGTYGKVHTHTTCRHIHAHTHTSLNPSGVHINSLVGWRPQELMVYQADVTGGSQTYQCLQGVLISSPSPPTHIIVTDTMMFRLLWQRSFAHPIHCLWYGDLTGDGLSEMVVVTMGGIHLLQVKEWLALIPPTCVFLYHPCSTTWRQLPRSVLADLKLILVRKTFRTV